MESTDQQTDTEEETDLEEDDREEGQEREGGSHAAMEECALDQDLGDSLDEGLVELQEGDEDERDYMSTWRGATALQPRRTGPDTSTTSMCKNSHRALASCSTVRKTSSRVH